MKVCCAIGCRASKIDIRTAVDGRKSFHRFPHHKPDLLERWVQNVRRPNWQPSKSNFLCSNHFTPESFNRAFSRACLRPNAVPTVFEYPPALLRMFEAETPQIPVSVSDGEISSGESDDVDIQDISASDDDTTPEVRCPVGLDTNNDVRESHRLLPSTVAECMNFDVTVDDVNGYDASMVNAVRVYDKMCDTAVQKLSSFQHGTLLSVSQNATKKFLLAVHSANCSYLKETLEQGCDTASAMSTYLLAVQKAIGIYLNEHYDAVNNTQITNNNNNNPNASNDRKERELNGSTHVDSSKPPEDAAPRRPTNFEHLYAKPASGNIGMGPAAFDHSYSNKSSTRQLRTARNKIVSKIKRRKVLRNGNRSKVRVKSMTQITEKLKTEKLITDDCADMLLSTFCDIPLRLIQRTTTDFISGHLSRIVYSPEIKKLASTLHSASPKAYCYVRDTFQICLPHPSIVKTWCESVDGEK